MLPLATIMRDQRERYNADIVRYNVAAGNYNARPKGALSFERSEFFYKRTAAFVQYAFKSPPLVLNVIVVL